MPGLHDLSDDELFALAERPGPSSPPPLSALSDEELGALASAPRPAAPDRIRVFAPDGSAATVAKHDLQRVLDDGYKTEEQAAAEAKQAEYGGPLGQAIAGAQGAARGLTFGLSDAASAAITGGALALSGDGPQLTPEARARAAEMNRTRAPDQQIALPEDESTFLQGYGAARDYQRDIRDANQGTALAGELGGALLGGGAGLVGGAAGRMLAATPAALATRAAVATSEQVAARLGGGLLGRVGATALGSAVEGGMAGAAMQVADAIPEFATDPQEAAEHILYGAGEGAILGLAIGGGLATTGELAKAAGRGAVKLTSDMLGSLAPTTDNLRQWAGESAYKAAVGRTNKASMKLADRQGGAAEVGQTLLDEGLPLAGSAEEILAATSKRADEIGGQLGAKVKEIDALGGAPILRQDIWSRIDSEVLEELRGNVFAQDILKTVKTKLTPFRKAMGALDADDFDDQIDFDQWLAQQGEEASVPSTISFEELNGMRKQLDQTLRYESAGPPTPTVQVLRKVRNELESAWLDAADRSAESVGVEGFADGMRSLKKKYAHLRLAADQAEEAVQTQLANRAISPSDYLTGIGTAATAGGPVGMAMGAGVALGHRYVRERGRGIAAIALNQMADLAERKASMVALATSGQSRLQNAAQKLVKNAGRAAYAAEGAAIGKFTANDMQEAIAEAQGLQDPNSELSQHLNKTVQQLDMINPGMGTAYANAAQARAKALHSVLPVKPLSGAVFSPANQLDPITERKVQRMAAASFDPQRALDRIANGNHSPEDIKSVQTVYPAMWKRFQQSVLTEFKAMKTKPDMQTRLRIAYATGLNLDPTVEVGAITMLQQTATSTAQEDGEAKAEQQKTAQNGVGKAAEYKGFDANSVFAGPVDARLDRR